MPYDAVIFDLDGTLVDTERLMFEAGETAFARCGLHLTHALFGRILGTDGPTGQRILAEALPRIDLPALTADWDTEIHLRFAMGIPPRTGAPDLLATLAARGLPLAVATSSGRRSAARKLADSGLAGFFEVVVTADDVMHRKPAPDPFLLAAERLGVDPTRCLAFEDSAPGAQAAHAAGMTVVLVPDMTLPATDHAHHVATGLLEGAALAGLLALPA